MSGDDEGTVTDRAEILLHPVRLRIAQALIGRELTTRQLAEQLPETSPATLYRHVARLREAGIIEVAGERSVRGRTERSYRLVAGAAVLGHEDLRFLTLAQHLAHLQVFLASLLDQAGRYLHSEGADPSDDGFGYRQVAFWLDDEELDDFVRELREVVGRYRSLRPAAGRRRRVLTTLLVPDPVTHQAPDGSVG